MYAFIIPHLSSRKVRVNLTLGDTILMTNPQLQRRVGPPRYLAPFMWDTTHSATVKECCSILHLVDQALPFDKSGLGTLDMASRILYATDGILGWMMKIVRFAAVKALHHQEPLIHRQRLAEACSTCIANASIGSGKVNPFLLETS